MIYLSNILFFFSFCFIKVRLQVTLKLPICCLKQTKPLKTSMKSSGNTLFHICFVNWSRRSLPCFTLLLLFVTVTFVWCSYSNLTTLYLQQLVARSQLMCHRFLQHLGGDALPQRQGQRARDSQLSHLKSESRFGRDPAFLPTVSTSLQLRIKRYYALL